MTRDSSRDEPKIGSQSVPDGNCLHFQLFGSAPKTKSRVYELENGLYSAMPVSAHAKGTGDAKCQIPFLPLNLMPQIFFIHMLVNKE